jgi:hypothetical protein
VFGSSQDALGVAVADIDRDDDLDVVATPVVGDQILDIWLNDGTGRFREADLDEFPPVLPRSTGLTIRGLRRCPGVEGQHRLPLRRGAGQSTSR